MIDARAVVDAARDPTRVRLDDDDDEEKILRVQSAPSRAVSVSFAVAGARGVGKTALVRRFFSECRREARTVSRSADADADADASWRSTPTIGMDYGAVTLAPTNVRGRFYDPSGAVEHAACRAEAFRAADAVVVVVDPDARNVEDDDGAIEETVDEIVRAREGASDDDSDDDVPRVRTVRVAFARARRSRPSRRVDNEESSDARLDRAIRSIIDARRFRRFRDSDDVRFVRADDVDDRFSDVDVVVRSRQSDVPFPSIRDASSTPSTHRAETETDDDVNPSNSFFTVDQSTGLGVRRVVFALARAVRPSAFVRSSDGFDDTTTHSGRYTPGRSIHNTYTNSI